MRHFVDVRFVGGNVTAREVVLRAGQRTRVIAVPRPFGADALAWTGWGGLAVAGAATVVGAVTAGVYVYARGNLENFSTHYASNEVDYNDGTSRQSAVDAHDQLTDLPAYGGPAFGTAGVAAVIGGALLFVGYRWSELFDPPAEESSR